MSTEPPGWLDIHGHFFPPRPETEDGDMVKALRDAHFMISEAPSFNPEEIIAYNDRAGISMQMLSNIPPNAAKLKASNDFGLSVVKQHPSRFGLLAGLATDQPSVALEELKRLRVALPSDSVQPDGFAVTTVRNGIGLGNQSLRPLWKELNKHQEVIFVHPNAYAQGQDGRPSALIDVTFDTARTITDMIYNRVFLDFPDIKWVFAHCGGAFPVLSGRVTLLGAESWVPNHHGVTKDQIMKQIKGIYLDTAATAETGMRPAIAMSGINKVIYGADCGVPCSTESTMEENRKAVKIIAKEQTGNEEVVGMNGYDLFPDAKRRVANAY